MSRRLRTAGADQNGEPPIQVRKTDPDDNSLAVSHEVVKIPINRLLITDSPRLNGTDPAHVRTLAEMDESLPPIVVHHPTMRIVDGMHRLEAARLKGEDEIEARYFRGNLAEVFRLAVRANVAHGLPLTQAERQAAAARIMRSHPQLSDRSIARTTGLAAKTVARIRRRHRESETDRRIGRDGRVRPLSTVDGRRIASSAIVARPDASLREIAQEAGVSIGTVRDVRARLDAGEDPVPTRHRKSDQAKPPHATVSKPASAQVSNDTELDMLIDGLRRDPSLRYTESGRMLLRWLSTHVVTMARSRETLDAVPPHCAILVAKVARGCADVWSSLATELERQSGERA